MISAVSDRTKEKSWYNRSSCNLTNIGLLTIGKHYYTLTGSSAFLRFGASETQDMGTANTETHQQREKALDLQGLSADF